VRACRRPVPVLLALLLIGATVAVAPAAGAATDTLGWPQFGRTARHLNTNPDEQAFNPGNVARLRVAWKDHYGDGTAAEGGPVVAGGFAYIAGTDGALSAFRAAGCGAASCEPVWQGRTDNNITGSPAVAGGLVLVGSADHFLYAFPAAGCGRKTCAALRAYDVGDGGINTTPALVGNTLYAATQATPDPNTIGVVAAFPANGCGRPLCPPRWTGVNLVAGFESGPVVAGGRLLLGANDNTDGHSNLYVLSTG
jgi:outer membrane protein assembly factor BamB